MFEELSKEKCLVLLSLNTLINDITNNVFDYIIKKQKSILNQEQFKTEICFVNSSCNTVPIYSFDINLIIKNKNHYSSLMVGGGTNLFNLKLERKNLDCYGNMDEVFEKIHIALNVETNFKELFLDDNTLGMEELREQIKLFFSHEI